MKERGILFQPSMVLALKEGRKTQTRRPLKLNASGRVCRGGKHWHPDDPNALLACPFGGVGDLLWVREAWITSASFDSQAPRELSQSAAIHYLADGAPPAWFSVGRYRHARFMPRWASRTTLEVTSVRIQWLKDISNPDCIAEGIVGGKYGDGRLPYGFGLPGWKTGYLPHVAYAQLWDSINGRGSWHKNPRVWAVTFKPVG